MKTETATAAIDRPIGQAVVSAPVEERVLTTGTAIMRGGLALIFLWFGFMKFTAYEATVIAPFIANSPLMSWLHASAGIQGASNLIGVVEVLAGVLLLAGFVQPRLGKAGGVLAVATFLATLSFLFTTPGVAEPLAGGFPALSAVPGQFLLKDLGLLAIAFFCFGVRRPEPLLRGALVVIFIWFGAMKFTMYEATGIAPFIANSPLVQWWHGLLGVQGASYLVGVFELGTAALLACAGRVPKAGLAGSGMAVITFFITLTFLFSTPGVTAPSGFPVLSGAPGQFLLKDVGLFGIAVYLLGHALAMKSSRTTRAA